MFGSAFDAEFAVAEVEGCNEGTVAVEVKVCGAKELLKALKAAKEKHTHIRRDIILILLFSNSIKLKLEQKISFQVLKNASKTYQSVGLLQGLKQP